MVLSDCYYLHGVSGVFVCHLVCCALYFGLVIFCIYGVFLGIISFRWDSLGVFVAGITRVRIIFCVCGIFGGDFGYGWGLNGLFLGINLTLSGFLWCGVLWGLYERLLLVMFDSD